MNQYNETNSMTVDVATDALFDIDGDERNLVVMGFNQNEPDKLTPFAMYNHNGGLCDCCCDHDVDVDEMIVHSIIDMNTMKCVYKLKPEDEIEEMLYGTGDKSKLPKGLLSKEK